VAFAGSRIVEDATLATLKFVKMNGTIYVRPFSGALFFIIL
jgi:hypothetical protein